MDLFCHSAQDRTLPPGVGRWHFLHDWGRWEDCPVRVQDVDCGLPSEWRTVDGQKRTCERCGLIVLRKI